MLNSICLVGRIFEDKEFEIKETRNGGTYITFTIEQPYFKERSGYRDIYRIHAFHDVAQRIQKFLVKNNWIVINGRICPFGKYKIGIICEKFDVFSSKEKELAFATDLKDLGEEIDDGLSFEFGESEL